MSGRLKRGSRVYAGLRDLRLDLLRGLAIYMIFLDHVTGDPLAKFTYRMIGFSDAAEIFVFVSGLACGIAYSRIFARQGPYGLTVAIAKRVARIYVSYAFSSIVVILLVTASMTYMGLQETFGLELDKPVHAIASALLMTDPPQLLNILLLYIFLTAFVVPPLVVAPDRYRNLALIASASIWAISQVLDMSHLIGKLFFNPCAWQFLFAIGVTLG